MQSTLTEPIGPRSPDEILGLVYQRTHHVRRRRRQQLAAAAAMVAMGVAGLVSLRPGEDSESRVRVVDDRHPGVEDSTAESATATSVASDEKPTTSTTAARSGARRQQPGGGSNGSGTSPTTPPVPTTTTSPTVPEGPTARMLAQASDEAGDADLPGWYWDVVGASMELDAKSEFVVFTTRYGTPSGDGSRTTRTLRSTFDHERNTVIVDVTEANNTLGEVTIDGGECEGCVPVLDPTTATLTVRIPVATMNAHLVELEGAGASIEDAVSSLRVSTFVTEDTTIDSSED